MTTPGGVSTDQSPATTETEVAESGLVARPQIQLGLSESMGQAEADTLLAAGPARLIVVAGAEECGKTTLLAALFDLFQVSPIAGVRFGGSRTLVGFERRCHGARIASDALRMTTPRTPISEGVRFLHLRVEVNGSPLRDLLISDISGELFRHVRDHASEAQKLAVVGRADHLAIVLDGRSLVDPAKRTTVVTDARVLVRSLVEEGTLEAATRLQLVVSKLDLLMAAGPQLEEQARTLVRVLERELKAMGFPSALHFVAARPDSPTPEIGFGYNLDGLLEAWVSRSSRYVTAPEQPKRAAPTSEFERLLAISDQDV